MSLLPDTIRPLARGGHIDAALSRAVRAMRPGWAVLKDCVLDGDAAAPPVRVGHVLLHPEVGIALLGLLPARAVPRAADRLRAMLDAAGFVGVFGGYPPIVYARMPARALPGLGDVLEREFAACPRLDLAGGAAWADTALRVLSARSEHCPKGGVAMIVAPPAPGAPRDEPQPALRRSLRANPARGSLGARALLGFWAAVGLLFGGGVLVLHYLGPPEPQAGGREGSAERPHLASSVDAPPLVAGPDATSARGEARANAGEVQLARPIPVIALAPIESAPVPPAPMAEFPAASAAAQGEALAPATSAATRTALAAEPEAPEAASADALPSPISPDEGVTTPSAVAADPVVVPEPPLSGHDRTAGPGVAPAAVATTSRTAARDEAPLPENTSEDTAPALAEGAVGFAATTVPAPEPAGADTPPGAAVVAAANPPPPHGAPGDLLESEGSQPVPATADLGSGVAAPTSPPAASVPGREDAGPSPPANGVATAFADTPETLAQRADGAAPPPGARGAGARGAGARGVHESALAATDREIEPSGVAPAAATDREIEPSGVAPAAATDREIEPSGVAPAVATDRENEPAGAAAAPEAAPAPDVAAPEDGRPLPDRSPEAPAATAMQDREQFVAAAPPPALAVPAPPESPPPAAAPPAPAIAPPLIAPPHPGPAEPVQTAAAAAAPEPRRSRAPAAASASLSPAMLQALIRRGDEMLALGDVVAARLLYERAANAGSAAAAMAAGRTYDPAVLRAIGAREIRPDPAAAAAWYARAAALGDPGAATMLRRLEQGEGE